MSISPALFSSVKHDWATPQDLFDTLHREYRFTTDAAASPHNAKLPCYFDRDADGLKQSWAGQRVWVNPPYGREIGKWVAKAAEEVKLGCELVVMLIPARTDTAWFHQYIYKQHHVEVQFIRGRLKFGGAKNSAPFPSMLVIFRP